MSIVAFIVGVGLPTLSGWMIVRLVENSRPVFLQAERIAAGFALGTTLLMWLAFVLHVSIGLPLNRLGFLAVEIIVTLVLAGLFFWKKPSGTPPSVPQGQRKRWEILVWILLGLATVKVAIAAVTFLIATPTYLDDALDNWNLRGKVFFETERLELVMPGEDPILSPKGVSSYPPTVPLFKASLAAIAGNWNDPLVNSVHALWFVAAAVSVYGILRRRLARVWAMLGAYAYIAMPLATMHGTNPYADVFVSLHVFLAAAWTIEALRARDSDMQNRWFPLVGLAFAALSFTKNEGIILYLPPLILVLIVAMLLRLRVGNVTMKRIIQLALMSAIPLLIVALPWLLFKWMNGLTFGNAKPFTSFIWYWRENVLMSIGVNTFFEGNWLLLFPLLFTLLVWKWKTAWIRLVPLTAFVAIVYVGQMILFLFTDLSAEALMQTGYARGIIQLLPCIVLLTTLLLADASGEEGVA